jgi:hypothetical protein
MEENREGQRNLLVTKHMSRLDTYEGRDAPTPHASHCLPNQPEMGGETDAFVADDDCPSMRTW